MLAFCGCRTPDPTVELLESELRWWEDNFYALDDQLDLCCAQLESARRNNTALRAELAAALARDHEPSSAGADDYDVETDEELYSLDVPTVELGEPDKASSSSANGVGTPEDDDDPSRAEDNEDADGGIQQRATPPGDTQPDDDVVTIKNQLESPEFDATDAMDPTRVSRIVLNRRLTGGLNIDGRPGHEGVMVVIEPQNAHGEYIAVPGDLTIEVTDLNKKGIAARVGKWQFDAVEAAGFLKKSLFGKGLHFELYWPAAPPTHQQLQVAVTYETAQGAKLRAERKIRVKIADQTLASRAKTGARTISWLSDQRDQNPPISPVQPTWRPNR